MSQPELSQVNTEYMKNHKDFLLEKASQNGDFSRVFELANLKSHRFTQKTLDTCLNYSIEYGHLDIVNFLLSKGAVYSENAVQNSIYRCCNIGDLSTLQILYEKFNPPNSSLNIPLITTCRTGHIDIVHFLLENKANVFHNDHEPIKTSIQHNRIEVVKLLLDYGVDVNNAVWEARRNLYMMKFFIDMKLITIDHAYIEPRVRIAYYENKFYKKWRRIYLRKWIRRVLSPLYYSPEYNGGVLAKKDIQNMFVI